MDNSPEILINTFNSTCDVSSTTANTVPTNNESITLIWFDKNIDNKDDTFITRAMLREINDFVLFFNEKDKCLEYIQSIMNEKIFLVISGSCAVDFLPIVHNFRQIDSIFIFCMKREKYEILLTKYTKIIDIFIQQETLANSIKENILLVEKHMETFNSFDPKLQKSTRELTKEQASFIWYQLFKDIVIQMPQDEQSKQDMIQNCRHYYRGNTTQEKFINEFEQTYAKTDSIKWYTKSSFVYKLINKALRTEDIEQLYIFRFYIADLSTNLAKIQIKQTNIQLYRGVKLENDEFNKIKSNIGKLIGTNGYLSTSRSRNLAMTFATKPTRRDNVTPVLFEITLNSQINLTVVADIASYSEFPLEQEVLFDLGAAFQIDAVIFDNLTEVWLIKMTITDGGTKIAKDYVEKNKVDIKDEKSFLVLFGILLENMGDYSRSIKYFKNLLINNNYDEQDCPSIYYHLGCAYCFRGEYEEALANYKKAYDLMMISTPSLIYDAARTLNDIGIVYDNMKDYDQAIHYHLEALKYRELSLRHKRSMVESLNNLGNAYHNKGSLDIALKYYLKGLKLSEATSNRLMIADCFNNIGRIHCKKHEFKHALYYHLKAFNIIPTYSVNTANNFTFIGDVYSEQKLYDRALICYRKAFKIRKRLFLVDHPETAKSLCQIGGIHEKTRDYDCALTCYTESLKIYERSYPNYPDVPIIQHNISVIKQMSPTDLANPTDVDNILLKSLRLLCGRFEDV